MNEIERIENESITQRVSESIEKGFDISKLKVVPNFRVVSDKVEVKYGDKVIQTIEMNDFIEINDFNLQGFINSYKLMKEYMGELEGFLHSIESVGRQYAEIKVRKAKEN